MEHEKMTALRHLEQTALRMRAEAAGEMAELSRAVSGAMQELGRTKQDQLTGRRGQVVGFGEDGSPEAVDLQCVTREELEAAIGGAIAGSY